MDPENQATIKRLVEETGGENLVVVMGSSNLDLARIAAATVTVGDPSFAGPLAGVSLRLPVYHILEHEVKEAVPAEVFDQQVGFMEMVLNAEEISRQFKEIRKSAELPS